MTARSKACRHYSCLSSRRISEASLLDSGTGWLCLTCFREWKDKTSFSSHGRSKNHPLTWVIPEGRLYCVPCGAYVQMEDLNVKGKATVETGIQAIETLLTKPKDKVTSTLSLNPIIARPNEITEEVDGDEAKKVVTKPLGLHNLGNTCFMNAALQSMAAMENFIGSEGGRLTVALFDLLTTMRDPQNIPPSKLSTKKGKRNRYGEGAINPAQFFDQLAQKYDFFERNEQQDSHDFMRLLFNALDDEHEQGTMKDAATHKKVFGGIVRVEVECKKCKQITIKKEPCMDISLAIEHNTSLESSLESLSLVGGEPSLGSLLRAWQRPQKLEEENAFACENCYRRDTNAKEGNDQKKVVYTPAVCRYSFEETPQCLIVHLQRFSISKLAGRRSKSSFGYGKDHRDVTMSHQFSPSNILCHSTTETNGLYQLKAMIIHEGATAEFGHYIAIVCRDDRWYRISDSSVVPIGRDTALSCTNAYIAFYEYKSA